MNMDSRIMIDEEAINLRYQSLLTDNLPSDDVEIDVRLREGYLEYTLRQRLNEQWVKEIYHVTVDGSLNRLSLTLKKKADTLRGEILLINTARLVLHILTGRDISHQELAKYSQLDKLTIYLSHVLPESEYVPSIIDIVTKDGSLTIGYFTQVSGAGGDLVVLEGEHQRFYDKLRKKIEVFIKDKAGEKGEKSAPYILLAPDLFVLLARLMKDPRVSAKVKGIAALAVAYFISPVDVIPEILTGPLGFLDDVVVAVFTLKRIMVDTDKGILYEHWNGDTDLLDVISDVIKKADELVGSRVIETIKKTLKL